MTRSGASCQTTSVSSLPSSVCSIAKWESPGSSLAGVQGRVSTKMPAAVLFSILLQLVTSQPLLGWVPLCLDGDTRCLPPVVSHMGVITQGQCEPHAGHSHLDQKSLPDANTLLRGQKPLSGSLVSLFGRKEVLKIKRSL